MNIIRSSVGNSRILIVAALVLGSLGSLSHAHEQDVPRTRAVEILWTGLEPGGYKVGYKVEHLYDESRTFPGTPNGKRPVQVSVWYPASSVEGRDPVFWQDYFLSAATETDYSEPDDFRRFSHLNEVREAAVESGADPDLFQDLLERNTIAFHEALPADGPFPLVVFVAGGSGPAFQNTVAYEYLASSGFVVVSFPSVGVTSRSMPLDETGASALVSDIEFVLKVAGDLAPINPERVALVGYSWGGMAVTFVAMQGADVDAIVALDSTLMVNDGHALARTIGGYQPESLKLPFLLMIADALDWKERDLSFLDELNGTNTTLLRFHDFRHGDFASVIIRFFLETRANGAGRDVARIKSGYAVFCRYLLAFLDAHLRDGSMGKAFLAEGPESNGIPAGVVSVERH